MDHADWLMAILTRPATAEDWYLSPDLDPPHRGPAEFAAHLDWLLAAPGSRMADYDDLSIAAGLHWIFDSAEPEMLRCLGHPEIPQATRLRIAAGLERLHAEVIAPQCPPVLGHRSEDGGPLAGAAYMLFDCLYIDPPGRGDEAEALDAALVETMGRILALSHPTCQEAALHGLGHWHDRAPLRCMALIDAYLAEGRAARPELVAYARSARTGCVL